jgi:hypothetical protein
MLIFIFYMAAILLAHFFMRSSKLMACPQMIETFGVCFHLALQVLTPR